MLHKGNLPKKQFKGSPFSFLPPLVFFSLLRKVNIHIESKVWERQGSNQLTKELNFFKESKERLDAFPFFPKKLVVEDFRDHIDDCFIFFASI